MSKLITRLELETAEQTPFALSHSIDYVFRVMLRDIKADMLSNPGTTYKLEISTVEQSEDS